LKAFRSDWGGEFTSTEFIDHFVHHGVRRQLTTPYTPQQNGVIERRNQMVVGTTRSMMKAKRLSSIFWAEAVATTLFVLNWSLKKLLAGMTPYEAWYDKKTGRAPSVPIWLHCACEEHFP
jgi:transposase InsO family protein